MDDTLEKTGDDIIQNTEKLLFDLAEEECLTNPFHNLVKRWIKH